MTLAHQGLSAAEIALLDDLDETGAPKEDDADRAASAAAADEPNDAASADDDELENEAAAAPAAAPAPVAPPADAPAQAPTVAAAPAEPTAAADGGAAPPPAQFDVGDPSKFDETRQSLINKKSEAMTKLLEGEIDAAAFAAIDAEVTSGLETLTANRTLHIANQQREQQAQRETIVSIQKAGAKLGIDYADAGLAALFDAKMQALTAKPENAGKSFHQVANEAHADVLKLFGKTAAAAPAPAPAPAAAPNASRSVDMSKLPPTLSRVPPAADASIAGDEFAHLANLDGSDLEKAVARMTPEQQERWLN